MSGNLKRRYRRVLRLLPSPMPPAPRHQRPHRHRIRAQWPSRKAQAMPFQPLSRPSSGLASALTAAGIVLAIASCTGHITPLGPGPTPVAMPSPRHLGSPIILQVMRSHPGTAPGKCPAGYVALSAWGSGGTCYRKLGTPVTITSAGVSSVSTFRFTPPPGNPAPPASYGFLVAVPAADVAAVTAAIRLAYDARGALTVNVDGKIWSAPQVISPFSGRQLQIALPSRNLAMQLYRILVPSG
jgi:hypothetical protein